MRNRICMLMMATLSLVSAWGAGKKTISPPEFVVPGAPAPMFSPGVLVGDTLYISGQIGRDLKMQQVPSDFEAEVRTCLNNIGIILKAAGMGFENVVSVQVYLTDMDLFARMNAVYASVLKEPRPTRTTVGVTRLAAPGARIEITMTARK